MPELLNFGVGLVQVIYEGDSSDIVEQGRAILDKFDSGEISKESAIEEYKNIAPYQYWLSNQTNLKTPQNKCQWCGNSMRYDARGNCASCGGQNG